MMQPLEEQPAAPFDYGQLEPQVAQEARSIAGRFRDRVQAYVIHTGRDLLAMKERLGHGIFLSWVKTEMQLTPRTAQNFMLAAEQFGDKSEIISHLPPTTLYRLAAPSTPAHVREDVVRRLEAQEPLAAKAIDLMVEGAKTEAKRKAAEEKEAARWAALSPEEQAAEVKTKKSRARYKARREAELEREWKEGEERRRAEAVAKEAAAQFLVEKMGEHLPHFMQLVDASDFPHAVIRRAKELSHNRPTSGAELLPLPEQTDYASLRALDAVDQSSEHKGARSPRAKATSRSVCSVNANEPLLPFEDAAVGVQAHPSDAAECAEPRWA